MLYPLKDKKVQIFSPSEVVKVVRDLLATEDEIDQDKEHFWAIHVDTRMVIKLVELVSLGTLNASLASPREIFTRAVAIRSNALIIAHNHPSGDATPSHEDVEITKKIKAAGQILDIPLLDHLVITKGNYFSFKEQGEL